MSSLPVAAQRRMLPRAPLGLVALVVVLAIGTGAFIGAMALSNRAAPAPAQAVVTTPKHHSAVPPAAAAATSQMASYKQLVANLAAARMAHDFKSVYRIDRALDAALTPAVIGMVYQEHARLTANLEAAYERHDMRAQALISGQVQALCGQPDVQSRLKFCN
jgi:hypothetical protein